VQDATVYKARTKLQNQQNRMILLFCSLW